MEATKSGHVWLGVLVSLTCAASTQNDGAVLATRALHCLATKSFLPHSKAATIAFGYFLDTKSWPDRRMLYVVIYPNRSKRGGFVYTLFIRGREGKEVFDIQNNASFVLSKNAYRGVSFVDPPLGGDWTRQHLALAIREIEKRPRATILVQDLNRIDSSFVCQAYTDSQ